MQYCINPSLKALDRMNQNEEKTLNLHKQQGNKCERETGWSVLECRVSEAFALKKVKLCPRL